MKIKMTTVGAILLITFVCFACSNRIQDSEKGGSIHFEGIEFDMPEIEKPNIPNYSVSLIDFGAVNGGKVLNTQAFEDAITDISEHGGGKLIIPAGIWLTGPIILESKLELHAEEGALIIFSENKDLYPIIETSFEGLDTWRCISPIYGKNIEDVAFTGGGVWDGSGDGWRLVKREKLSSKQWENLVKSGGIVSEDENSWYPSEQFRMASENANMNVLTDLKSKEAHEAIKDFLRPVMVSIQNSKRVMFDGPVFQNSPAWCIHPLIVENLILQNLTIRNPWYSQNGDGIDVESCKNVLIENCNLDVGDDAICIKSGKDKTGRERDIPCENLVIRNNIVYHGHGGVTVGSEMSSGVKNMHVSNCTFMGTDVGLRFKSKRGRGGIVENIYISDIQMTNIPTIAISFNLYYGGLSVSEMLEQGNSNELPGSHPVSEETPQFRNITISDVILKGAKQAVRLQGLPEMNLENVNLSNMILDAEEGFSITDASKIKIENIKLSTKKGKAFFILNSKDVDISGVDYDFKSPNDIIIRGKESSKISFSAKDINSIENYLTIGEEVQDEIQF